MFRIGFIVLILILPWSIRNYMTFNKIIPFTTSVGLNLYRGNNPLSIGEWGDEKIFESLNKIKTKEIEIAMNEIYMDQVIKYVKQNPIPVLKNCVNKGSLLLDF